MSPPTIAHGHPTTTHSPPPPLLQTHHHNPQSTLITAHHYYKLTTTTNNPPPNACHRGSGRKRMHWVYPIVVVAEQPMGWWAVLNGCLQQAKNNW